MAISSTPTLRKIITEVYGSYDSSKTFRDCQADVSNKEYFTSSNPINSMRSWDGYDNFYILIVKIYFMDAAALGYTKVGAMVTFNFGNGISYGGSLEGFIQSFEGSNIIYTMEMKVPQKEIAFGRFTIGAVVFNNSFPLREGELGLTNPMNTRRIPYYLGDISEVNGGMVDPPYTDIIDPFEVRVVSYR